MSGVPFRQSSFFFGRRGSGRNAQTSGDPPADDDDGAASAAAAADLRQPAAVAAAGLNELQQALLDGADMDIESAYDDRFVFSWRRLLMHVGPGALMCIAYVDPGNLEADLQTGATTGYTLLWVLLWSTTMGYLLQSLAARLGVATGKHLAEHCREQYPPGVRHVLWLMAELAIIGSDIQEVIGTSIALLLLSNGAVPLWAGVLLAAAAAYTMLFLEKLGVRYLEYVFEILIGVMSISMGFMFFTVDIPYGEVAKGLALPKLERSAIPIACGLLGAIIMPHNLFLHSALVHSRPVEGSSSSGVPARRSPAAKKESVLYYNIESGLALVVTLFINVCVISVFARGFFGRKTGEDIGLANAGEYLGATFGKQMAVIWAVGLLAAGQSSTMTGTYAGQFVMGGFLNLKVSAGMRTLITRGVAICPTMLVAISAHKDSTKLDTLNQWINILQSVQLPFAVIPLLLLTSDKAIMGRRFVNSPLTAAVCWLIAALIITINASTAFETLAPFLPQAWWLHLVFWAAVSLYVGFLVYLILTPEGAQQLAASISWNVSSYWIPRLGDSSSAGGGSSGNVSAAGVGGSSGVGTAAEGGMCEPAGPLLLEPAAGGGGGGAGSGSRGIGKTAAGAAGAAAAAAAAAAAPAGSSKDEDDLKQPLLPPSDD